MPTRKRPHLRVIEGEKLSLEEEVAELVEFIRRAIQKYPPGCGARIQLEAALGRHWEAVARR